MRTSGLIASLSEGWVVIGTCDRCVNEGSFMGLSS